MPVPATSRLLPGAQIVASCVEQPVAQRVDREPFSVASVKRLIPRAAVDGVIPVATGDCITVAAPEDLVAAAARERRSGDQVIASRAAVDGVAAPAAVDGVAAPAVAEYLRWIACAIDHAVAGAGNE